MKVIGCRIDGVVLQRLSYSANGPLAFEALLTVDGHPLLTVSSVGGVPPEVMDAWEKFAAVVEQAIADSIGTAQQEEEAPREPKSIFNV